MEYHTKLLDEKEKVKELEEENDEPWDLADRFYEEWWDEGIKIEMCESFQAISDRQDGIGTGVRTSGI